MKFNYILVLLISTIALVQTLQEQACDCRFCSDTHTVSAHGAFQIYNSAPCEAGTAAFVSTLNVQTTDGSGVKIYTKDNPTGSSYYPAGSSISTVTCFKMSSDIRVGGRQSTIYVVISCEEFQPCPIRYSIQLGCGSVATTSTIQSTSTSTSTFKPVSPTTIGPIRVNNTCDCECCKGSAACVPTYVGTIFYGANRCEESNCVGRCSQQFSNCPINGKEPGKIKVYCKNSASVTLKNRFYISLLILFIYLYLP